MKKMLAFIKGGKPGDPIEATLLGQMAATDAATMVSPIASPMPKV